MVGTPSRWFARWEARNRRQSHAAVAGKRTYSLRKETVEPVFGQIKEGRGLRRFRLRGLAKVREEWALWCVTHNPRELVGVLREQRIAARAAIRCSWAAPSPLCAQHPALLTQLCLSRQASSARHYRLDNTHR